TKAEELAKRFGVPRVYDDAEELLKHEELDFIDIITDVDTHEKFTLLGAKYGLNVICQKPLAPGYDAAKRMIKATKEAGVRFYVHENYRWQPQFRLVKKILDSGVIGKAFRCETAFVTAFPVFETQPFLAELREFALTDQGSHQFDVLRYLFGEAETIYCEKQTVNPSIKGEDVTTSILKMACGTVCIQKISFSSPLENEIFPQTTMLIEGDRGSIRLDAGFELSVTTPSGTTKEIVPMRVYPWQTDRLKPEPPSIVDINQNILDDMLGSGKAENTGDDNFETVRLVWAAYESANSGRVVRLKDF
ncbi:MAG TPA: gfo/Idh/MocA family oxidoreductase, partial [Prolixibacteraceae bacterium]|nr:gfo/Idh/MocA family oxidoreductase [Prolixibacteraceae bacterium]